jgi:nucleoside-diphosphate-sugar epimerase
MRILVIGGTGHIGGFLVPELLSHGFDVTVLSTGRTPIPSSPIWKKARKVQLDYASTLIQPREMDLEPEVVIDLPGHLGRVVEAFAETAMEHLIACGSVWMFGRPTVVPVPERFFSTCRAESYARRYTEMQELFARFERSGPAFTAIMPPNIAGPGKIPLEGMGGRSLAVHEAHRRGEEVPLPDGPEALIGPSDAEDIAHCFVLAVLHREKARGETFNTGSAYALTASQFIATLGEIHGARIPIRRVSWEEYKTRISPEWAVHAHFEDHMCPDISKARRLLGYEPRYTPEQSLERGVKWMLDRKLL